jgi:hypothetical protein
MRNPSHRLSILYGEGKRMNSKIRLYEHRGDTISWVDAGFSDAGDLQIEGYDLGQAPKEAFDAEDLETTLTLPAAEKDRLLLALLTRQLGGDPLCISHLRELLQEESLPYEFQVW